MATKYTVKQGPPGSAVGYAPAVMTNMMVSLPVLTSGMLYFRYTATDTGRVLFDTMLSTTVDGEQDIAWPQVYMSISGPGNQIEHNYDEDGNSVYGRAATFVDVIKGEVYDISLFNYGVWNPSTSQYDYPLTYKTLRISDFGKTRTGTTPDQTLTGVGSGGAGTANHSAETFLGWYNGSPLTDGPAPWGYVTGSKAGYFTINRALGGPAPGTQDGAIGCCWQHARQMAGTAFDSFYWGGAGEYNVEWSGAGYCEGIYRLEWHHGYDSPDGWAGYRYKAGWWSWWDASVEYWVYHGRTEFSFKMAMDYMDQLHYVWAGDEFGDENFGGLHGNGYTLTWALPDGSPVSAEDTGIDIYALDVAPDEYAEGGDPDAFPSRWFWGVSTGQIVGSGANYGEDAFWQAGEFPYPDTDSYWVDGLEAAIRTGAGGDLGTYGGGYSGWTSIPSAAIAQAKAWEEMNNAPGSPYAAGGLKFAVLPYGTLSPTPMIGAANDGTDVDITKTRQYQALATRVTASYPNWVVIDNPAFPDATAMGIAGAPTNIEQDFVGRN